MTTRNGGQVMSLQDIADLAAVQRSVVSMWRRRPIVAGEHFPFPEPVAHGDGGVRFDSQEIVGWLERTGRGNNPDARADAAAYGRMPGPRTAAEEAAVSALLCMKAGTGQLLAELEADEILDLADELDPDDDHLYREIEAAPDLPSLARYVDELTDAAYSVQGALERLSARAPAPCPHFSDSVISLIGEIGAALAVDLDTDEVELVDVTGTSEPLTDAVSRAIGETIASSVRVAGTSGAAREARRRHLIRGCRITGTQACETGAVELAYYPNSLTPDMTPADILQAADNFQLELDAHARGVVLAPASVLCDALNDHDLELDRSQALRLGRIRGAIRLPPKLLLDSPRQSLGIWIVGPEPGGVSLEDRLFAAADLSDGRMSPDVIADLTSDIVAACGDIRLTRAHSFRFARITSTATVLAERGPLVPPGVRSTAPSVVRRASDTVLEVQELARSLAGVPFHDPLGGAAVEPSAAEAGMASAPLGEVLASGWARVLPGLRLDPDLIEAEGTVPVLTADALRGRRRSAEPLVDPVALELRHPRVRRTEPGDVVFCTAPRPAALVDHVGGSVVATPARVLRCDLAAGVVPEAVALAINALPEHARVWRSWRVPVVDPVDARSLARVLGGIEAERAAAGERIEQLGRLSKLIVAGVADRAVTIEEGGTA